MENLEEVLKKKYKREKAKLWVCLGMSVSLAWIGVEAHHTSISGIEEFYSRFIAFAYSFTAFFFMTVLILEATTDMFRYSNINNFRSKYDVGTFLALVDFRTNYETILNYSEYYLVWEVMPSVDFGVLVLKNKVSGEIVHIRFPDQGTVVKSREEILEYQRAKPQLANS